MGRLFVFLLLLAQTFAAAAGVAVSGIRTWAGNDTTRVVFDLSGEVSHTLFTLDNPSRVVVDLKSASGDLHALSRVQGQGLIDRIRAGARDGGDLRVVLDLKGDARAKSFLVQPSGDSGHRLVVELQARADQPNTPAPVKTMPAARQLVIAIDAGHGGQDPGAIGPGGTYEKDVTLAVAKKLAALIEKEPGMKPLLIRTSDRYIGLRERKEKARRNRADMFVSLHADAVRHGHPEGSSVYTLSRRGASTEAARLLAERENSADLIGGVSLEDKDDLVATVLLDLSRAATVESSLVLAQSILGKLGTVGKVHKEHVEQAGFVVLKSLDMPSVLVELAFISTPAEERKLRNGQHQWRLARAILDGLKDYRDRHMPGNQLIAERSQTEHVVQSGETLSAIAQRYEVSLDRLRSLNNIANDEIHAGSRLVISQ